MTKTQNKNFNKKVVNWYDQNGRKNLPWQGNNSYHVWLSEIMLQQTQVIKVIDYFHNFITHFPTLKTLAQAETEHVLACWSGLGYYNRARNLHKTAKICQETYNGKMPTDFQKLVDLPGIGRTTAGAILSLASDLPYPIMDGNVKRVMSRAFTIKDEKISALNKKLWNKVTELMPSENCRKYNQALMDLGSLICKRSNPNCLKCPLINDCKARRNDVIELYPQKNKKTIQKNKTYYLILAHYNKKVFLQQRKESGIWPELWFLPMYDSEKELIRNTLIPIGNNTTNSTFTIQHILSHRKLNLIVQCFSSEINIPSKNNEYKWVEISQFKSLPHPTALVKIMEYFLAH